MCLVYTNRVADDGLEELARHGQTGWDEKLAVLAAEDTTEEPRGLALLFDSLKHMPPDLRHVRKYRIGHHRAYFTGHHSHCEYDLFWVKIDKKSGVDQEGDKSFQRKLLRALGLPRTRVLQVPDDPTEEE